jgi:parvulin-like peptidyl-prolyl isomerase
MKLMAKQEKTAAELYREERKARIAKAAKKNAKKQNKVILTKGMNKAIAAVIVIAIVAGIGAFSVSNSGMLERGKVAFNIGDVEVTAPEYGFYYTSAFNNYFQYSYQYDTYYGAGMGKMYTGYDYSISPDQQKYEGEIEGVENPMFTDFFADQAISSLQYVKASVKYAQENGIELDEKDMEDVEAAIANFKETADSMNYSLAAYLRRFFHKGLTADLLEKICEEQTLTTKVSNLKTKEFADSYTEAKIDETYFKSLKTYGAVSLRFFDIAAEKETVKAKEEGKEDTQEVTDKTMAAAKLKADAFVAALATADFKDVAAKYAEEAGDEKYKDYKTDDNKTLMKDASYDTISYETTDKDFLEWVIDTDTKAGETYIVKNDGSGYSIYMMVNPVHKVPDSYTYDVRHILVKFPEEDKDSAEETEDKEEVKVEALDTSKYDVTVDNAVKEDYTNAELYVKAQDILKKYLDGAKTEDSFAELAVKYSEDGNAADGGIYEGVTQGYMVAEFENWALKDGRKAGDVGIVETTYGYHIMYFIESEKTTWSDIIRNDLAADDYNEFADELGAADNVKVDGKVEESLLGVEKFIVSLAKEQIRNINANAGHSADDGHNH